MGEGRKSSYVKTLTSKDQKMLHAFRSVGYDNTIKEVERLKAIESANKLNLKFNKGMRVNSVFQSDGYSMNSMGIVY